MSISENLHRFLATGWTTPGAECRRLSRFFVNCLRPPIKRHRIGCIGRMHLLRSYYTPPLSPRMASQTTGSSKQPDPHGYIHADSDEPLLSIDQSNFVKLMSLSEFRDEPRIALAGFKSRWNKSQWMQAQIGYLQKACLAAASLQWDVLDFCRCGLGYYDRFGRHHFMTCRKPILCPSCNLHKRVEPCEWEFLPAFDQAPFWYALTFGWQSEPRKAGLRLVTKQDELGHALRTRHWLPWSGRCDAPFAHRYDLDAHSELFEMAELAFAFAGNLCPRRLSGLYASFEWQFAFYPRRDPA